MLTVDDLLTNTLHMYTVLVTVLLVTCGGIIRNHCMYDSALSIHPPKISEMVDYEEIKILTLMNYQCEPRGQE